MKKKIVRLTALLFAVSMLVACGSSSHKSADFATAANNYVDYEAAEGAWAEEAIEQESAVYNDPTRKLIKTYNLDVETEDFDMLTSEVNKKITELKGYVENLNTYNGNSSRTTSRYSNMTIRIPASSVEEFVTFIGNSSNLTNKSLSVEDVTLQYVDAESRKKTYQVEQDRLLEYLEKAESIEDIITIESRLSDVRYNLESQEAQLRTYDNLVDYSTVYLYIREVVEYTAPEPVGYGERVWTSFVNGLKGVKNGLGNFVVFFVGALPHLVILGIVALAVILIVKRIKKSKAKRHERRMNKENDGN